MSHPRTISNSTRYVTCLGCCYVFCMGTRVPWRVRSSTRVTLVLVSSCSASADPDPVSKLQYPSSSIHAGPRDSDVRCQQSRVKCQAWLIVTNSEGLNWGCQRNFAVIFFILKFEIADFQRGKGLLRIMDNVKVTVKFCWHLQFKSFERCLLCLLWESICLLTLE